jgi:hypothetical protein
MDWDRPHLDKSRNKGATTVDHAHRESGPKAASAPVKCHFARTSIYQRRDNNNQLQKDVKIFDHSTEGSTTTLKDPPD